jgi:pimeloyl-ACP methyl ester carboxylesterase
MAKTQTRKNRHSGLFYRNTAIVWTLTVFVFVMAFTRSLHWASMLIFLLGIYLNYFMWNIYLSVHPRRSIFRRDLFRYEVDQECEQVTFLSLDGLKLSGWLIPGDKRKVILLIHGLGGSGTSMMHQARLLNKAGYSVMMPDLRAHGDSEGDTITGVWEVNDILGALEYLDTRSDVTVDQVGILGISFGAQVALQAAAKTKSIRAVVLESMGPATLADHGGWPTTLRRWVNYPLNWLLYALFDFISGVHQRNGVIETLHLIYPRPILFISTGRGKEKYFMRLFFDAARHPKSLFEVPQAEHGIAMVVNRQEYGERVLRLFDQALG